MGDDGQMILLSALVACLCLIGVMACLAAADDGAYADGGLLDGMDNVGWARDCALRQAAHYSSSYPWESRAEAALHFKSSANSSLDSLAGELLAHGEVYRLSFNDSLAADYAAAHSGIEDIDGVLVAPAGGDVKICGCAFDELASDGATTYRKSRVLTFD